MDNPKVGDAHYKAYVGPPENYDIIGASQFCLLFLLGLRANHRLLDFGCGSLRAGRFLIPYLDEGNYYGIEPNRWLIDDAVRFQTGHEIIRMKKPSFAYNDDFRTDGFDTRFDYILAQSILSHAGLDVASRLLANFKESLQDDGLIALTFMEGDEDSAGNGWSYPDCVTYRLATIKRLLGEAEFYFRRLPWPHPRQTWYILAKCSQLLDSAL